MHAMMPRSLSTHLTGFLNLTLTHLNALFVPFRHFYVIPDGGSPPPASSPDDPDQDISLSSLASSMLDFLSQAMLAGRASSWFTENSEVAMEACIRAASSWSQMTEEDVRLQTNAVAPVSNRYFHCRKRSGAQIQTLLSTMTTTTLSR